MDLVDVCLNLEVGGWGDVAILSLYVELWGWKTLKMELISHVYCPQNWASFLVGPNVYFSNGDELRKLRSDTRKLGKMIFTKDPITCTEENNVQKIYRACSGTHFWISYEWSEPLIILKTFFRGTPQNFSSIGWLEVLVIWDSQGCFVAATRAPRLQKLWQSGRVFSWDFNLVWGRSFWRVMLNWLWIWLMVGLRSVTRWKSLFMMFRFWVKTSNIAVFHLFVGLVIMVPFPRTGLLPDVSLVINNSICYCCEKKKNHWVQFIFLQ